MGNALARRATLNNSFTFLSIGSVFIGLNKIKIDMDLNTWLFIFLFIFLRIKMWLDDAYYLATTKSDRPAFKIAVIVAIISWAIWSLAGYSVSELKVSYRYMILVISISTLWILIECISDKWSEERILWLLTNAAYFSGFCLLLLVPDNGLKFTQTSAVVLLLIIVVAIFDMLSSKSFEHLCKE